MKTIIIIMLGFNLCSCKGDLIGTKITSNNFPIHGMITSSRTFVCIDGLLFQYTNDFSRLMVRGSDNNYVSCREYYEK